MVISTLYQFLLIPQQKLTIIQLYRAYNSNLKLHLKLHLSYAYFKGCNSLSRIMSQSPILSFFIDQKSRQFLIILKAFMKKIYKPFLYLQRFKQSQQRMSMKKQLLQRQQNKEQPLRSDPEFRICPKSKQFIEKLMRNVVLISFVMGYTVAYFNAINFQDLMLILGLGIDKSFAQGFFTGCIPASACVGALLSSKLLKLFTRKHFFYIISSICMIGISLIQTKVIILIIVGRLLQGLAIGIGTAVIPLYIKQFVPQMNGKYGLYNQLFFTIGIVWAFLLNLILHLIFENPSEYWRILFAFPILVCVVQAYSVHFNFNFQTPRYLVSISKNQEALDLIRKIYKQQFVQTQFQLMFDAVHSKPQENQSIELKQFCVSSENYVGSSVKTQVQQQKKDSSNPLAVFCALHLAFQQQIIGIGVIIVYSGDIIEEIIPSLFYYYAIIVNSIGLCCVFLSLFLIKRFGRVILLQVGASIISICLLIIGINFMLGENRSSIMIGVAVVILRGTFSSTLGPIAWLYMAETVKPDIIPYGTFINWMIATLVMFSYPILTEIIGGPGWIFLLNGVLCILTTLVNALTLVETKNRNQLEIRQDFDKKMEWIRNLFFQKKLEKTSNKT